MPSTSERTFGQRYTKARDLVEYLKLVPTYAPSNPDLAVAAFDAFVGTVDTANNAVASQTSALQTARDARLVLFKGPEGLIKRCAQIRDYISSIETKGKNSVEYKKAQKVVMRMRGIKLSKKKISTEAGATEPKTISTSEVSFGSMLNAGKEVLQVINGLAAYAPSNTNITSANFAAFVTQLDNKNSEIASKLSDWDNAIETRADLYATLKDRVSKIKSALAGQYGRQSNEYKDSLKY